MRFHRLKRLAPAIALAAANARAAYTVIPYTPAMAADTSLVSFTGRSPVCAINGSGLDANGCHTNNPADGTMWMANSQSQAYPQWFRVDLGGEHELAGLKIWNFNFNNGSPLANRGISTFEIYTAPDTADTDVTGPSPNPAAWTKIGATHTIPAASGQNDYAGEAPITWAPAPARWVLLNIMTIGPGGYGGISEIQFLALEQPVAVRLDAIAVASANTLGFAGELALDGAPDATLVACYGASDGGMDFNAWDVTIAYENCPDGPFAETLPGIPAGGGYYFNLAATNAAGAAWAGVAPAAFITAPADVFAPADFYNSQTGALTFERPASTTNVALTVSYEVAGGVVPGVHYKALPGFVTFDAGVGSVTQLVEPVTGVAFGGDQTVVVTLTGANFLSGPNGAAAFTIRDNTLGGITTTWTGAAGGNNWDNAGNWDNGIPGPADTAVFEAAGTGNGMQLMFNGSHTVYKIVIGSPYNFQFGGNNEWAHLLSATEIERTSAASGTHTFRCGIVAVPDAGGDVTWNLGANGGVILNNTVRGGANVRVTRTGAAALEFREANSPYSGSWHFLEGKTTASADNSHRGETTIGGGDIPAEFYINYGTALPNDGTANFIVLTNGFFNAADFGVGYARTTWLHVKEGGYALVSDDFNCTQVYFDGGTVDGGKFTNTAEVQAIGSFASDSPAFLNAEFYFAGSWGGRNLPFNIEKGGAHIDLTVAKRLYEYNTYGSGMSTRNDTYAAKNGPGVLRLTAENSMGYYNFYINEGTLLVDNETGNGIGHSWLRVQPGATIGGTGFIGGFNANSNLTLNDGGVENYATLAPGTIDPATGRHVAGTFTVGTALTNSVVAFGNHSRLRVGLGDCLDVHGAVTIGSDATLEVVIPDNAKPGKYVLAHASEGFAGGFANVVCDGPGLASNPRRLRFTTNEILYHLPRTTTLLMVR